MQPLYSVDHETRQNSKRDDSEGNEVENRVLPNEDTPLLHRFPVNQTLERSAVTMMIVAVLLSILVFGVIIGIYLLIIQNNSENVLPPVDTPLQLVSRSQWDVNASARPLTMMPMLAKQVIVVQTDSAECYTTATCTSLLQKLQANSSQYRQLPYNFLVSTNGQTYEALGWRQPSPMFPQYTGALLLAFIGNFTEIGPSQQQMDEAVNFFAESISRQHLLPQFAIIGKNTTYKPELLFQALMLLPQWSTQWSDD